SAAGLPDKSLTAKEIDSDIQGLVVSRTKNQAPRPIASILLSGADVLIRFGTVSSNRYALERSEEIAGRPWKLAADNILGTGGIVQAIDRGGAGRTRRFYRVRLQGGSVTVPEGGTTNFSIQLAARPTNNLVVSVGRSSGTTNLNISSG